MAEVTPWHNVSPPCACRGAAVCLRCAPLQPAQLHGQGVLRQQEEGRGHHHPAPGLLLPEHPGALQHAPDGAVRHEVLQLPHVQRRAGYFPERYRGEVWDELPVRLEMWLALKIIPVFTQHLQSHQDVLRCPFLGGACRAAVHGVDPSAGMISPRSNPNPRPAPSHFHPLFPPPRRRCPGKATFPTQPPPDDLRPPALPPRPRGTHSPLLLEAGPAPPQAQ